MKNIRQGDVLLQLQNIKSVPAGASEIKPDGNRIVLAYGEVTGHAHAIYENIDQVKMWAVGKVKYLEVMARVTLKHEEHSPATIEPGIYKLPTQVEYTPQALLRT